MNHNSILIFTDGASKGNPGPGGFGAVVAFNSLVQEIGGREEYTTNNRMELRAAIEALSFLDSHKLHAARYALYADSSYLIHGITRWIYGWKKNGWITTAKKEVENKDLWQQLLSCTTIYRSIQWIKVAGHADTPGNARADEIASAFGDREVPKLYFGPREKYQIDLSVIDAREGSTRNKGETYSYVSCVDDVIETHKTWKECEARVKGKRGARFKKAFSKEEEESISKEFAG